MSLAAALALAALVAQLFSLLVVWWNHRHTPDVSSEPPLDDRAWPTLSVIVPARNEEANIGACVESLAASTYPGLRVRVVDDGSTDRTGEIVRAIAARDGRIEVIAGEPLPPGWMGKPHALHVGVRGLPSDYLLFVDADLRVTPDCLHRVVARASRSGAGLLTMIPRMEAESFWERAVQPLVGQLVFGWMPAKEVNDPASRRANGIGPFMLFRRDTYERIGGHEAVRADVIEDLRLAEIVKHGGHGLLLVRGVSLAAVRMYDSLPAIVRGWSKNFHVALGRAFALAPLLAAGILVLFAGPFVTPPLALLAGDGAALALGLAALAALVAGRVDLRRRYAIGLGGIASTPLGASVIAFILLRSAFRAATGRRFVWKGREV